MDILFIAIGIICGVIIGALFMKGKNSSLSVKMDMTSQELDKIKSENNDLKERLDSIAESKSALTRECDRLTYENESLQTSINQASNEDMQRREEEQANFKETLSEVKAQYEEQIADLKEDFRHQQEKIASLHEKSINDKETAHTKAMAAQEQRHNEAVEAMQVRFSETMEKVTAQVKNATETMLKERQEEFAKQSNTDLGQIVNPLRETIDKMKKAMEESATRQTEMSAEMRANIENMIRHSQAAKESADELSRVFRHESKVQGDWGEMVLDELLNSQGFTKGIHYDTQAVIRDASGNTVKTEEGAILRPDIILHLDRRRELIIDSKVSLTAFFGYVNAESEEEREKCLDAHVASIKKHVEELSVKDYSSYIQSPKVKMNYVIMFMPHTGALWTALNAQKNLWRWAMDKNVFIADEQTLFAALRIINMTWTQIAQAQNHEKVFKLANEMLNRVGQFWAQYEAMGNALKTLQKAYDKGKEKITEGGQSINTTANQLIRLGARQNDRNPLPQLIDIDDIPPLELTRVDNE